MFDVFSVQESQHHRYYECTWQLLKICAPLLSFLAGLNLPFVQYIATLAIVHAVQQLAKDRLQVCL
jgi:hypothetical protein